MAVLSVLSVPLPIFFQSLCIVKEKTLQVFEKMKGTPQLTKPTKVQFSLLRLGFQIDHVNYR